MNRGTPEHLAISDVSISMVTHYFDESFLRTEEDYVNTYSKYHLSYSIVEDTIFSEEFAMILCMDQIYHEKWIKIFGCYLVSAIGLKKYLKISNLDICILSK